VYGERTVGFYLAGEVPAQKLTGTKGKAPAIVLIEVATAVLANIDA
jgi:hypothetical protein